MLIKAGNCDDLDTNRESQIDDQKLSGDGGLNDRSFILFPVEEKDDVPVNKSGECHGHREIID